MKTKLYNTITMSDLEKLVNESKSIRVETNYGTHVFNSPVLYFDKIRYYDYILCAESSIVSLESFVKIPTYSEILYYEKFDKVCIYVEERNEIEIMFKGEC